MPWALTQLTPDPGIRVATTGFPQDIASICTIAKASVFQIELRQNTSQALYHAAKSSSGILPRRKTLS